MELHAHGSYAACTATFPDVFSETDFDLVVFTVDGVQVKLYKNGVAQTPHIASAAYCPHRVTGNRSPLQFATYYFGGTIKSFAVWDRILSPNEIASLENGRLTCP